MTDWKTWQREHPDGTVVMLSRTSREYRREFYRRPEQFVLGISSGGQAMAWGFDGLSRQPLVYSEWNGSPVMVVFDRSSATARLYERRAGGRLLSFRIVNGKLTDDETGSVWELTTGKAVAGPLAGHHLKALPAIVSYRGIWFQFHAKSQRWPSG